MKKWGINSFFRIFAVIAMKAGIIMGGNITRMAETDQGLTIPKVPFERYNTADSIADIITEMKYGDQHRVASLAEAYRYGVCVEKNMLNALICYMMAGVDFESEAKRTIEVNPSDEFARLFIIMNMYDRHYMEEAEKLLSSVQHPAPAWMEMMRKVIGYKGSDINDYILSLISPESTNDEVFLAFGCYLSNNKENNDLKPLKDLLKVIANKVPYFYNKTGYLKLEEYKKNSDEKILKDALMDFKKANDSGFLTPRNARRLFEEDIRNNVDLDSIFTKEEIEQLRRLGASTSSESNHSESVESEYIRLSSN